MGGSGAGQGLCPSLGRLPLDTQRGTDTQLDAAAARGDTLPVPQGWEFHPRARHCATLFCPPRPLYQSGGTHLFTLAVAWGQLCWLGGVQGVAQGQLCWLRGTGQPGLVIGILCLAISVGTRLPIRVVIVTVGMAVTCQVA